MPVFFIIASMTAYRQQQTASNAVRSSRCRTMSSAARMPITGSENRRKKPSGKNVIMHRYRSGTPSRRAPFACSGTRPRSMPNVIRP